MTARPNLGQRQRTGVSALHNPWLDDRKSKSPPALVCTLSRRVAHLTVFKLTRVPRPSFAWAGRFHHKLRSRSSQTERRSRGRLSPCPGDCGVSRKPASYTSSPSAVIRDDQTSRTLRAGLRSRLLSNGCDEATDFASTAMS